MDNITFVEDEFGNIGIKISDNYGGFKYKNIILLAESKPTTKKTALKNIPSLEEIEILKLSLPKKTLQQQFKELDKVVDLKEISWAGD